MYARTGDCHRSFTCRYHRGMNRLTTTGATVSSGCQIWSYCVSALETLDPRENVTPWRCVSVAKTK